MIIIISYNNKRHFSLTCALEFGLSGNGFEAFSVLPDFDGFGDGANVSRKQNKKIKKIKVNKVINK